MNQCDCFIYLKNVDKQTQLLRNYCLGYHVPLALLLPDPLHAGSTQYMAMQLAQQLLFHLAEHCPEADRNELEHSWQWLYAMLLYLFQKCSKEDQTVGALIRLAGMDYFDRHSMYRNVTGIDSAIQNDLVAPPPLNYLDVALLTLLDQRNLLEDGKTLFSRLTSVL